MGTLSPRGEGKVTLAGVRGFISFQNLYSKKTFFSLAPWGEGVHRTGEGLFVGYKWHYRQSPYVMQLTRNEIPVTVADALDILHLGTSQGEIASLTLHVLPGR